MQTRRAARLHADSEGSISLENIYDERKFREKAVNWIGTYLLRDGEVDAKG